MIAESVQRLVYEGRMYDLAYPIAPSTPVFGFHLPFSLVLHRRHGDTVRPGGASFANELMVLSAHTSTHIDAIGHFSRNGCVHGGTPVSEVETHEGLAALDAASLPLLWSRGVLLDVAAVRGVDVMAAGEAIGAVELEEAVSRTGVSVTEGDVTLVRTGWGRHWTDPETFNGARGGYPGVSPDGARWLVERSVRAVGSDTPAFEVAPPVGDSVHAMLLVDAGVPIIENLDLEELAAHERYEFLFVALPLRIQGATGSPIRPIAVV